MASTGAMASLGTMSRDDDDSLDDFESVGLSREHAFPDQKQG
jgi:hypothetical protein